MAVDDFATTVRPLVQRYCVECHSSDVTEADIDLGVFITLSDVHHQSEVWLKVRRMLDSQQMPPQDSLQPSDDERLALESWVRSFLADEARTNAGDPGPIVLRRLNNEEYNYTVCDLTSVNSLKPTREFPVDGAAGEGFINTGSAQSMSPALVSKYLGAAKEVASHVVLLPDGIRFSPATTRRDQTDELLASIQAFYRRFAQDGGGSDVDLQGIKFSTNMAGVIPIRKYLAATLDERDALTTGRKTIESVADERSLSTKYLRYLWQALSKQADAEQLSAVDQLRLKWQASNPQDVEPLASEIEALQKQLWKFNSVGQLTDDGKPKVWMEPVSPTEPSALLKDVGSDLDIGALITEFRDLFPTALCYINIVPVDEVVTLTLFFREDAHLQRLMLDEEQTAQLDRLWDELLYVAQEPLALVVAFEQIYEFATQDRPDLVNAFAPMRGPINERGESFRQRLVSTEPMQLDAVVEFANRAWRRTLLPTETASLRDLYAQLRQAGIAHDESIRLTITRVLASPAFLYRHEQPVAGKVAGPVTSYELASRLSYFLWSSAPDAELLSIAEAGQLQTDDMLLRQTQRMLGDAKIRRLAIQFACQWLHLRDFDQTHDKNERLYPEFSPLQHDMYEETVLFFEDMFRGNGSILGLVNADHTFVNASLAMHYGIPDVVGPHWRRIDDVQRHGRGGVLGMATFLASQSGASRTSPILRGNWVYETLLGQRLPRPPANVPQLPESLPQGLSARQLIEQHSSAPQCARCHLKIDPFGFALEQYDAIGRQRLTKADTQAQIPGGELIDGIDGLRNYLMNERLGEVVRQFCHKLLGFALGREVQLSDEPLLDKMEIRLRDGDYRFHIAVESIVLSEQFRNIRGNIDEP